MSLLALIAAHAAGTDPPDPPGNPDEGLPVATAPYNALTPLATPTPDGSGQATHPDVCDFGVTPWNGYRFWMAMTPYASANVSLENPCVLVSNDRTTWVVPPGGANPVDPFPGGSNYNSDTDLAYDPATGRLWLYYREAVANTTEAIHARWSTNGTTWSAQVPLFTTTNLTAALSPAVVRVGPGDWRMWCIGYGVQPSTVRTASSPEGPWSAPTSITFTGLTNGTDPWHVDVVRDPATGTYHMLLDARDPWGYWALTSTDGVAWTAQGGAPFMVGGGAGTWDQIPYRAGLTLDTTGLAYDVWYGGTNSNLTVWRVGHTRVPRSLWTG